MSISSLLGRIILSLVLLYDIPFTAHADTGRRVALVIGNGAYQNAPTSPTRPTMPRPWPTPCAASTSR